MLSSLFKPSLEYKSYIQHTDWNPMDSRYRDIFPKLKTSNRKISIIDFIKEINRYDGYIFNIHDSYFINFEHRISYQELEYVNETDNVYVFGKFYYDTFHDMEMLEAYTIFAPSELVAREMIESFNDNTIFIYKTFRKYLSEVLLIGEYHSYN